MDLTQFMMDLFGPYGGSGVVLMVFLAFYIDATVFPFLPEIFIILGFSYDPTPPFAVTLIAVSILAECLGNCTLYLVVKRVRVPRKVRSLMNKYVSLLIVNDERMLLVNRIAPLLPYSGAFIALTEHWKLSRALMYVALGCILKYGLILSMSTIFFEYFSSSMASVMMIVFVLVILALSLVLSHLRQKGMRTEDGAS